MRQDCYTVLGSFRAARNITARSAALRAVGSGAKMSRIESLRRRVSDLVREGYVVPTGFSSGMTTYSITSKGREVL